MKNEQIKLLQNSFEVITPVADLTAHMFYMRLFELNPRIKIMFKANMADMDLQRKQFINMLEVIIQDLDNMDNLTPTFKKLGIKHIPKKIKDKDYITAGEALLWSIEQALDSDFTPEVKEAWNTLYGLLVMAMEAASVDVA